MEWQSQLVISFMENSEIDRYSRDVWQLIQAFNSQRDRQALTEKYRKMRKDAFTFFRGTCHLFYQDLPQESTLNLAPVVWICGD